MKSLKSVLDKILALVCIVVFSSMVIATTYQVIVRYIFNSPSAKSEVITRYLFVWLILYSAAYVFGKKDHIYISIFHDKLKGNTKKLLNILIELIIITFALLVMVYGGLKVTRMNMLQFDSILNIPTGIIYSCIPISGILIIFYSIYNIVYGNKVNMSTE